MIRSPCRPEAQQHWSWSLYHKATGSGR